MVEVKEIKDADKRSFYDILAPRVVKVELTVKENNKKTVEVSKEEAKAAETSRRPRTKRVLNQNMEELETSAKRVKEFLSKFLEKGLTANVEIKDFEIYVDIEGEDINYLIGYRGETIKSLQIILACIANKGMTEKTRIYLDIAGYRSRREKTLEDLAEKIAKTVIRTRKAITLEPMTAYERKVIHTKLQENDKIETYSKGEEPYRKIVVALKK